MDRVKGKVAIITGAAGGLGKSQALLLAKEGAKVVVTDIDGAQGKRVSEEINGQGGEAIVIQHDVTSGVQWNRVISETLEQFRKLDILVNNAGVNLFKKIEDTSAYHASKGGVRLFTKAAALECSKAGYNYNIRVNSVHPGVIETPIVEDLLKDENSRRIALDWHPIGRFGEPEDVAYAVLFLASDESKFMTGAELVIDGGWTAN